MRNSLRTVMAEPTHNYNISISTRIKSILPIYTGETRSSRRDRSCDAKGAANHDERSEARQNQNLMTLVYAQRRNGDFQEGK